MKKHMLLIGCLFLAGCGTPPPPPPEDDSILATQAADMIDVPLSELLTKPRVELASMVEELEKKLPLQLRAQREQRITFLKEWHPTIMVPGLRQATYSTRLGISLPPYVKEDDKDSALAVHLAQYGDVEAAGKLVEPTDAAALKQIEAASYERNYPIEWTRLIGLLILHGEIRAASGDADGLPELLGLHKQIGKALDLKATQGMLGAILLPRGREVLQRAARSWRSENKTEWAEKAEAGLQSWGAFPELPQITLQGRTQAELQKLLRTSTQNKAWLANSALRAIDLLQLPFPEENIESLLVWFDNAGNLGDLLLTYRPGLRKFFPAPIDLGFLLEEHGLAGKDAPNSPGLLSRSYSLHGLSCEITIVAQGAGVGGFVRMQPSLAASRSLNLGRELGAFNLDRSFEQNRLVLAPQQRADVLVIKQPMVLAQLPGPLVDLKLGQADVYQGQDQATTDRLVLRYAMDVDGAPPLGTLALSLWNSYGPPSIRGEEGAQGGQLNLSWADSRTEHRLQLPYDDGQPVLFEVRNRQVQAEARSSGPVDQQERKARIQAGKPLSRLPRDVAKVALGMKRERVLDALPTGKSVLKRDFAGGLAVTFTADPAPNESAVLRQLFVRFDKQDQVAEVRGRYAPGAQTKGRDWAADILGRLRRTGGAPQDMPVTWSKLWSDLPPRKPAPTGQGWQDDVTLATFQRDAGGLEVTLRDCPLEHPEGAPLPSLAFLSNGEENIALGMKKEPLLALAGSATPERTSDGAYIVRPQGPGPFDIMLVWLDKDLVVRIVGRHASSKPSTTAAQASDAIRETWGSQLATLGWPRRQDVLPGGQLQGLGWHDDQTRLRLFWQENDAGAYQLFTEWRQW